MEIETIGAQRSKTREPVSIFLTPSKLDILTDRLNTEIQKAGLAAKKTANWHRRMMTYDYDYLVINDDLEMLLTSGCHNKS